MQNYQKPILYLYTLLTLTAYDFLNSNRNRFNVNIWYNATYTGDTGFDSIKLARIPRSVNLV